MTTGAQPAGIKALDWRFLLPTPAEGRFSRLVLAGASDAVAGLVEDSGIADEVDRNLDGRGQANAVACLGGTPDVGRALATLADGGVLYLELDRRLGRNSLARTVRQLMDRGVRMPTLYWAHPGFKHAHVYLPLQSPGAVDWYFETLFVVTTARARLLTKPVRAAASLLRGRLAPFLPHVSVVGVAGDEKPTPSVLSSPALPPAVGHPDARPLVLMSGGEWSRVILFPFAPGARRPLAAVKLWRLQGREEHLERERKGQELVRELLDASLRDAVPKPLGTVEWSGLVGNVEECARGHWVFARRHRRERLSSRIQELEAVAGWLTSFNANAQIDRGPWNDEDVGRWVEEPIDAFQRAFTPAPGEARLFSAATARAHELTGVRLPFVWCHNDFSELNLYCELDAVGVVDWETIAPGLPTSDLLHYVQRWFFRSQRATRDESRSFASLFLSPPAHGRAVDAAQAALRAYSTRLQIDERFFSLLLTTEWIRRGVARHGRSQSSAAPSARRNRFAEYVAILAQHVPTLFERPYRWEQR